MMNDAIKLAKIAAEVGEVPVGCVITLSNGEVIAAAHNLTETNHDPTAHAEILAIKEACRKTGYTRLEGFDMYVTLEPCAMCAAAISFARIRRLYYGAFDVKMGAVENGVRFFNSPSCHHHPEIYSGMMENECSNLLKEFFEGLRG